MGSNDVGPFFIYLFKFFLQALITPPDQLDLISQEMFVLSPHSFLRSMTKSRVSLSLLVCTFHKRLQDEMLDTYFQFCLKTLI